MQYKIIQVSSERDLTKVIPLFDHYRQFYRQSSDMLLAKNFLTNLFNSQSSVIFMAVKTDNEACAVGFTQLYPMFSSVAMKKYWVLNDLYVVSDHRRNGIAKLLIDAAHQFAKQDGGDRVVLKTEKNNVDAKQLYQQLGYVEDSAFDHYVFNL